MTWNELTRPRGLHWGSVPGIICHSLGPLDLRRPLHVFLCLADHYEPLRGGATLSVQRERVARWVREYPRSVAGLADSRGRSPQHTFFYPAEEYVPEHLEAMAGLCRAGHGDVDVHLHHDNDCSDRLRETLESFKEILFHRHGLLARSPAGQITYGFIHGNWALDNSRPDGRWCGVNDELSILRETGCYADFTMPSAPNPCQTRTINSIYYARDDRARPNSHDRGTASQRGVTPADDALLMIQGPLLLGWKRQGWRVSPALENGELHGGRPPTLARFKRWLRAGVGVVGTSDWIFIKLHTHGALERNAEMLLGEPMRQFHYSLAQFARRRPALNYYYVTAREMAGLVRQAEQGAETPDFSPTKIALTAPAAELISSPCSLVG